LGRSRLRVVRGHLKRRLKLRVKVEKGRCGIREKDSY
jgi:hypothetical protein